MTDQLKSLHADKFGRLTVTGDNPDKKYHWLCRCECGNAFSSYRYDIIGGHTKSCGCLAVEASRRFHTTHGESLNRTNSKELNAYYQMKSRCLNKNSKSWHYYGGRGIKVCGRWLESFDNFIADMGRCPDGKSLDRKNTNGNYDPDNCRWATRLTQANNMRSNHTLTFMGMTLTISEWSKKQGINYGTLFSRISRSKWPVEKALTP